MIGFRTAIRASRGLGAVAAIGLAVNGCGLAVLTRGWEVAVQNESGQDRVVMVALTPYPSPGEDETVNRYYASEPGTSIVVDTVGHLNGPPDVVVIMDASCGELERVGGDLTSGARIVLTAGDQARVDRERLGTDSRRGPDETFGQPTCEAAVAELQ